MSRLIPLVLFGLPFILGTEFSLFRYEVGGDEARSWAISLAVVRSLRWGADIVFSHGPLMFLTDRVVPFSHFAEWALLFGFLNKCLIGASTLAWVNFLRLTGWRAVLFGVTFCLLVIAAGAEREGAMVLITVSLSLLIVVGNSSRWIPLSLGVLIALAVLIKTSIGIATGGTLAVALALSIYRTRRIQGTILAVLSFTIVLFTIWVGVGQQLSDLPLYLFRTVTVVGGYPYILGMGNKAEWGIILCYWVSAGILVALCCLPRHPLLLQVLAVLLFPMLIAYKHSVVRMGGVHVFHFPYLAVFAAFLVLSLKSRLGGPVKRSDYLLGIVVLGLAQLAPWLGPAKKDSLYVRKTLYPLWAGPMRTWHALQLISDLKNQKANALESSRRAIEAELTAPVRTAIGSATLDVWSDDLLPVLAADVAWKPRPTITKLLAASPTSDSLDHDFFVSRGSERFLYDARYLSTDGVYDSWCEPFTFSTVLGRYSPRYFNGRTMVMDRLSSPRLSEARELKTEIVSSDTWVEIPAHQANQLVFASLEVRPTLVERLKKALVRPSRMRMGVRFADGTVAQEHFVYSNSHLGLLVSVVPQTSAEMYRLWCELDGKKAVAIRVENTEPHLVAGSIRVVWSVRERRYAAPPDRCVEN